MTTNDRGRRIRRHGMTVARGGVVVAKRLDVESLPLPAVSYELRSERDRTVEVTLVEHLPSDVDPDRVGFHPNLGGDGWTCYADGELVWRGRVDPGESNRVVLGVWLDAPETATSMLTPPTVEAVRATNCGGEPHVLDDTFVAGDSGASDANRAVADAVPADALRSPTDEGPSLDDLPDPGEGLTAPTRRDVDDVVDAVAGGESDATHGRYYHLRLSVETVGRGVRDVSVLEDLTNALSVLHADADDRDGGAWRVLDVAIGTNWQAERIVTALGDDHRVSGLVVTELTGAVTARRRGGAVGPRADADPNPDEFATSVFETNASARSDEATPGEDADLDDADNPDGEANPEEASVEAVDPDPTPTQTAEPTAEAAVDDGEFGEFVSASVDDDGVDGDESLDVGFQDDGFDADGLDTDDGFDTGEFGDEFEFGDADSDTTPESEPSNSFEPSDDGADELDEDDDSMAVFAELQAETEQADVEELDEELDGMVLSPTGDEEYSIGSLLESVDEDPEPSSV